MRELTIAECEVVSGGHLIGCDSACSIYSEVVDEVGGVSVTGVRPPRGGGFVPPDIGGGGWDGGGDGGEPPEDDPCRSYLKTPNPENGSGNEYKIPTNFNINLLLAAANSILSIPNIPGLRLVAFKDFVGPGEEFDFKSQTDERESYVQADGSIGTRSIYDAIGNWAYGFLAEMAGIEASAFMAWLNEQFDGDGVGEDPIDQMHIKAGYEAAKAYKESGVLPGERNVYCGGS